MHLFIILELQVVLERDTKLRIWYFQINLHLALSATSHRLFTKNSTKLFNMKSIESIGFPYQEDF